MYTRERDKKRSRDRKCASVVLPMHGAVAYRVSAPVHAHGPVPNKVYIHVAP